MMPTKVGGRLWTCYPLALLMVLLGPVQASSDGETHAVPCMLVHAIGKWWSRGAHGKAFRELRARVDLDSIAGVRLRPTI